MRASNRAHAVVIEIEGDGAALESRAGQLSFSFPSGRIGDTYEALLDESRLTSNTLRVLRLLLDGQEHALDELRAIGGSAADSRVRDLRSERLGGFTITSRRDPANPKSGRWLYRLIDPTHAQIETCLKACGAVESGHATR